MNCMPTSSQLFHNSLWALLLFLGLTLSACSVGTAGDDDDSAAGDDDDSTVADALELEGTWTDNWGTVHTISSSTWSNSSGSVFNISQYDNDAMMVIAQNDAGNDYNPLEWSRFDWHVEAGTDVLRYCQPCYDCADEATALATPAGDTSDLANSGCGGFGWSSLTAGDSQ